MNELKNPVQEIIDTNRSILEKGEVLTVKLVDAFLTIYCEEKTIVTLVDYFDEEINSRLVDVFK